MKRGTYTRRAQKRWRRRVQKRRWVRIKAEIHRIGKRLLDRHDRYGASFAVVSREGT